MCAEHTWTEDRQPPKTVVWRWSVRRTPDITALQLCLLCWKSTKRGTFPKRGIYVDGIYVTSLRFVRTGVMKVMWVLDRSEHSRLENYMRFRVLPNIFQILATATSPDRFG